LAQNTDTFADDLLLMGPESFFFPSWLRMNELFLTPGSSDAHSARFAKSYCVHLWETADLVTTGLITPESIAEGSSTISLYAGSCLVATTNQSASLVFLTHNRLCDLQDCLPTYVLLAQARDDIVEILIYDNNSDAETKEYLAYLEQLPLVRVIYGGENIGVAGGRAVLFKEAMGDIIFSLDSDSKSGGEGIIDEAKEILSDPGVGMCGTAGCMIHSMDTFDHTDHLEDGDVVGEVDSLAGCCQIFRRDVLDSMHMDLAYAPFWLEDTDLCLQLRAAGLSVQRFASKGRFIHEWGATGDKLFPDSFHKKFEYFKSKWCS
jgi:GT2 family glycosyltransferase